MDERSVLGIDVGVNTIKVFEGTVIEDGEVLIANTGSVATEGFVKGSITDYKLLATAIKKAVDCAVATANVPVHNAYLGIGGMDISSLDGSGCITLKEYEGITQSDIDKVCRAAVLESVSPELHVLHILPKNFFIDGQKQDGSPLMKKGTQLKVDAHIVTVPKQIVEELSAVIKSSGMSIARIVANGIVSAKIFAPDLDSAQPCLLIDMGAGTTDLVVYNDGHLEKSASLLLGGEYITRDIMQGFVIDKAQAEKVKRYYGSLDREALRGQKKFLDCNELGIPEKEISYDFLHDIIESRVDEIICLVYDYLKPLLMEQNISKIFLTGGCAVMPSIKDCLERVFGIPVQIILPRQLVAEYAYPGNTACYGIICHAAKLMPQKEIIEPSTWGSLVSKIKKFF